jgi:predicted nucleic acid-binding protein
LTLSNTSPIIYLAKIRRLDLLKNVYGSVRVCSPVWQDILHLYKRGFLSEEDFSIISQARKEWITLQDPKEKHSIELVESLIEGGLGLGEAYSIALAKELGEIFLANDKQAIEVAKKLGVKTRWFTEILHDALRSNYLKSVDEYVRILDACISQGLYVSRKQRERAIEAAKKIV